MDKDRPVDIGRLLAYLVGEYEWAVERGESWDDEQLVDFAAEQPLGDEALDDLRAYAEHRRMTSEQRAQYDDLLRFIEQHRQVLDRLMAE